MKNLNIMMTIKANSTKEAESIVTRELAELAKRIAFNNGSFMIGGKCDVTEANGNYKANANMEITDYASLNDTIYTMQALWMTKPDILKSVVFVSESEEKKEEPKANEKVLRCDCCDCVVTDGYISTINPNTDNEYEMCADCLETAMDNGDVELCEVCNNHVSDFITNPVTGENNLCPCCGNNLFC